MASFRGVVLLDGSVKWLCIEKVVLVWFKQRMELACKEKEDGNDIMKWWS